MYNKEIYEFVIIYVKFLKCLIKMCRKVAEIMERQMKDYLEEVAIRLKIENFKEFGKTKEETQEAIMKKFKMSKEQALEKMELLW